MATTRRLTDQQIKQIQESTEPVRIVAAELGISKTAVHYYRNQRDGTRRRLTDQQVEIIEASTKPVRVVAEELGISPTAVQYYRKRNVKQFPYRKIGGSRFIVGLRVDLLSTPMVAELAQRLSVSKYAIVAGLYVVATIAATHGTNGVVRWVTRDGLNADTGLPGFAEALETLGWIEFPENDTCRIPGF